MPKQILLVDDSVTVQRMIEITFAREDYQVTSVKSGDEGIARAKDLRPDLVLADAGLPGKSGYDVVAAIKAEPSLSQAVCLILTGNFAPYDEVRGAKAGADGGLVKPFETQALIDRVNDLLSKKRGAGTSNAPTMAMQAPTLPPPPPPAPKMNIEPLSKPLSVVAQETKASPAPEPYRPKPPAPTPPPVAVAPPAPPPPAPRAAPPPRATLMGIPAINLASLSPGATPLPPSPKPVAWAPPTPAPAPPDRPATLQGLGEPAAPTSAPPPIVGAPTPPAPEPYRPKPPVPTPPPVAAPSASISTPSVHRDGAHGRQALIPTDVPRMPRPSLIPHTPTPTARAGSNAKTVMGAPAPAIAPPPVAAPPPPTALSSSAPAAASGADAELVARISREIIERIAWEVVPELAETIIKEHLDRLVKQRQG